MTVNPDRLPERQDARAVTATARLATVIASTPGIAEQSLKATLAALPWVQVVGAAAGCLSALHMVRDRQADLVVIDSNLPLGEVRVFLQQLKREGLPAASLVLAVTHEQVRRALAAGADVALLRDVSEEQLGKVLSRFQRAHWAEGQEPDQEAYAEG